MANSFGKMIHMATDLKEFAKKLSKVDDNMYRDMTTALADKVRDRLLKGVHGNYDIDGKQFKSRSKFTNMIRKRDRLGIKNVTKEFGDTLEDIEARIESMDSAPKIIKKTDKVGKYRFNNDENGHTLFKTGGLVNAIGNNLKDTHIVFPEKTTIRVTDKNLKNYQKLQGTGFRIPESKFSRTWKTKGKSVPARRWFGVPVTYREGHPGWQEHMQDFFSQIQKMYGMVVKGGKPKFKYIDKRRKG